MLNQSGFKLRACHKALGICSIKHTHRPDTERDKTSAMSTRQPTPSRLPSSLRRFAEPEIIQPSAGPGSTLALWRAIMDTRQPRRPHAARIGAVGVVTLAPVLIVITVVILLALLVIFVTWLSFVGTLFAATLAADLMHYLWHRAGSSGALGERALGYLGR
jgi:hypothetical protein